MANSTIEFLSQDYTLPNSHPPQIPKITWENKPKICEFFSQYTGGVPPYFNQLTPSDGMSFVPDMRRSEARLPST